LKHTDALVALICGIVGIIFGLTADRFYPGMIGPVGSRKPLPKWFGRIWCVAWGVIWFYMAVRFYLRNP